jgi:hypothetical protein
MARTPFRAKLTGDGSNATVTYTVPANKIAIFSARYTDNNTVNPRNNLFVDGVEIGWVGEESGDQPINGLTIQALTASGGEVIKTTSNGTVGIFGFLYDD